MARKPQDSKPSPRRTTDRPQRRNGQFALALVAGGVMTASSAPLAVAHAQPDAEAPIRAITMYRSGVAHYERRGLVDGAATIQLRFATGDVNDILKSMYLLDLDGGRIEAVSYASREPLSKRLSSFAIDISDMPTMGQLLTRLRGARVEIESVDGRFTGVVLGVERRETPISSTGDGKINAEFVNLLTSTGARSVMIGRIAGLKILDEQLAGELDLALEALAQNRTDNIKGVDLRFNGIGERRVVVGYVREAPVWKTSYRLILPDVGEDAVVQGWAIVENTTDEDWDGVRLSLVAGQPIGFTMDLYEPLFIERPDVPVPVMTGVGPRVFERGLAQSPQNEPMARQIREREAAQARRAASVDSAPPMPSMAPMEAFAAEADFNDALSADDMQRYSAAAQAAANQIGEVFQYTLEAPVSIERQKSAMLPILTGGVEIERVSIFGPLDRAHPMRGVQLTNSSGLQLMPGPIAVFDGAAYAGDAQIGHISEGEDRLLAYAVDLDVVAGRDTESAQRITRTRIVDGVLVRTIRYEQKVTFTMSNKDKRRDRVVIIEQPRTGGWELSDDADGAEPFEQTPTLYRYRLEIPKGAEGTLTHAIGRTVDQTIQLLGANIPDMLRVQQRELPPAIVTALQNIARLQGAVQDTEVVIAALDHERRGIEGDQDRIRRNMQSIDRDSDLYRRYITTMGQQETRLEALARERAAAQNELEKRRQTLRDAVRNLNVG